jgi:hypothetical protein
VNATSLDKRWTRSNSIEVSKWNYTSSDPFYIYHSLNYFNFEGTFRFAFEFSITNCSQNPETGKMIFQRPTQRTQLHFSIENNTLSPDLTAATEGTCDQSPALGFNITDLLKVPATTSLELPTETGAFASTCAVVPTWMPSKFDPCKPKIDSSTAASISAAMSSHICSHWVHETGVVCPTPTSKSGYPKVQVPDAGAWFLGMVSLLAYSLA